VALDPGRYVLAAGWFGHGQWDIAHHVANRMAPRWYAEFCTVADILAGYAILFTPCPCHVRVGRCRSIRPDACRLPSSRQADFSFGVSASCEDLYPLNLPFGRFPPPVALVQR